MVRRAKQTEHSSGPRASRPHALVVNHWHDDNKGDSAITTVTLSLLRRQWAEIDPTVSLESFESLPDGRLAASVRQVVRDRTGKTLSDQVVVHTYSFRDGLIAAMEIRKDP